MSDYSFTLCAHQYAHQCAHQYAYQYAHPCEHPCEHFRTYITLSLPYHTMLSPIHSDTVVGIFFLSFLIQRKKTSSRLSRVMAITITFSSFLLIFALHSLHHLRTRVNTRPPLGTLSLPYHTILSTSHSRAGIVYFYLSFLKQRKKTSYRSKLWARNGYHRIVTQK